MSDSQSEYLDSSGEPSSVRKSAASSHSPSSDGSSLKAQSREMTNEVAQPNKQKPGRRKQRAIEPVASRKKRLQDVYTDAYRHTFNETLLEITNLRQLPSDKPARASQIGAVIWSGAEKEKYFQALSRLGDHNAKRIAESIQTKTELEVRDISLLLQRGLREYSATPHFFHLIYYADIPAALEVSEQCCAAADLAAESLEFFQQKCEDTAGRAKWSDLWNLTSEVAAKITEQSENEEEMGEGAEADHLEEKLRRIHPAFEVLCLENWIELSERILMNTGTQLEDNWNNIAEEGEAVSIRFTAFTDFYNELVKRTRKLVLATLAQATSRLRASDTVAHGSTPQVRPVDVQAAIEVLDMKANSQDYWNTISRRRGLHVYDTSRGNPDPRFAAAPLSYEAVEMFLASSTHPYMPPRNRGPFKRAQAACPSAGPTPAQGTQDSDMSTVEDGDGGSSAAFEVESEQERLFGGSQGRELKRRREMELEEDEYAEMLDRQASVRGELQLWSAIGKPPPSTLTLPDTAELCPPRRHRKEAKEMLNWRDNAKYQAEWEEHEIGPKTVA